MALIRPRVEEIQALATPPCVARYAPVLWEPLLGTGERLVALLCVEPHDSTLQVVARGTYVILGLARLRAILGRQRGLAAFGVLREVAAFMTERQRAGLPIGEVSAPFRGFTVGPTYVGRAQSVEQLLDAAVRNVSAVGSAEEIVAADDAASVEPRHTVRTSAFLSHMKRLVAVQGDAIRQRFDRRLRLPGDVPEVTVDYAFERWLVQVTSLPTSPRQTLNAQREAQSKLLELQIAQRAMDGNAMQPVLLVNEDALQRAPSDDAEAEARAMQERFGQLAKACGTLLLQASTPEHGVGLILNLHDSRRARRPVKQ